MFNLGPVYTRFPFLNKMSAENICNLCGKNSLFRCSGCLTAYYCSKEHQKQDWKSHKINCISYKVEISENLGRHLVAARAINEGEIILEEKPLVEGPAQETPPVCLACYRILKESEKFDCSRCGWPMCSRNCSESHLHLPECEITANRDKGKIKITSFLEGLSHPSYQCLTVLRCLSLKKRKPDFWKKLQNLESHCDKRKVTSKHNSDYTFISRFIIDFFNFTDFSNEEILKIAGIVQVNAHEVPLTKPGYIAIYEKASLLEHNCRANCTKSFTNSGNLVIRAGEKIQAGDHLSICYTDPLWGRTTRLKHLLETKFFFCKCFRCLDPTEFGTHFNSIKCRNGICDGYSIPVLSEAVSERRPKDITYKDLNVLTWTCVKCKNQAKEEKLFEDVNKSICKLERKSVNSCMNFLKKYKNVLHENHHLMVNIKLALIDLLGWPQKLLSLEEKTLNYTMKTCEEVYEVTKTLIPSENRLLGVLLYQWHFVLMEKGQRIKKNGTKTRQYFMKGHRILKEAYKCLQYEPDKLPEGMMAKEAKRALENINK